MYLFGEGAAAWVIKGTRNNAGFIGMAPAQYFARWDDLAKLWPALKVELLGVSDAAIWVKQAFIDGEVYTSSRALEADLNAAGWLKTGPLQYLHEASGAVIGDVKPSNVIKGLDGKPWPFDVIVESTGTIE